MAKEKREKRKTPCGMNMVVFKEWRGMCNEWKMRSGVCSDFCEESVWGK